MENTDKNIFITGKAGTGKSTLLNYFRSITKKKIVVLAPTEVSALNIEGETIHFFFGFKPNVTIQNIEGIFLKKPIKKSHIMLDRRIVEFLTKFQYQLSEKKVPLEEKIKIIEKAIEKEANLSITYLKPSDEKSKRIIKPYKIGEFSYNGKTFLGVSAYCYKRKEDRTFRIDRILEIEILDSENSQKI
ncbi:MAG: WYL domain-containing protein [bacterium]